MLTKFYFSTILILLNCLFLSASDTLFVKLDFMEADQQKIKVQVVPKFEETESPIIVYIKNNRGIEKVDFEDINIAADTKISREDRTSWWIKDFNKLDSLSYTIKSDYLANNSSRTPALIKLEANDFYFAQMVACVPFVTVAQNYVVALEIKYPEALFCPLAKSEETIYFDNQITFSNQSVIIGRFENTTIVTENMDSINLLYFTDYKLIKLSYLKKILSPFLSNLNNYITPLSPINKQLILCCFKNAVGVKHDFWGGVANTRYSLITLPVVRSVSKFNEILYETFAHEFLHTITPFNLHTDKTFSSVRGDETYSKHLWLYEGVIEYLTWKFLLENNYISERKFMDNFGAKVNNGNKEKVSLSQLSQHIHQHNNADKSSIFYERGAIIALLLDILINEHWKGEKSLFSVLLEMIEANEYYNDATFIAAFERIAHPTIGTFLRRAIDENQLQKVNEVLKKIGWQYNEETEETIATYGVFNIKRNYKKPYFTVVNVGRNQLGFQNGDALLTLNEEVLTIREGNNILEALKHPELSDTIKISIARKGTLMELEGTPGELLTPLYHVIRNTENISAEALELKSKVFLTKKNQ